MKIKTKGKCSKCNQAYSPTKGIAHLVGCALQSFQPSQSARKGCLLRISWAEQPNLYRFLTFEMHFLCWPLRYVLVVFAQSLHNFASHRADAFRMMAVSLNSLANKSLTTEEWRELRGLYMI